MEATKFGVFIRSHPMIVMVACLVLYYALGTVTAFALKSFDVDNNVRVMVAAFIADIVICLVCAVVLRCLLRGKIPVTGLFVQLGKPNKALCVVLVCFLAVLVWLSGSLMSTLLITTQAFSDATMERYSDLMANLSTPYMVYAVIMAPLCEELLFRGVVFGRLCSLKHVSPLLAALLSSVVFAAGHLTSMQFFATFLLGLLNCWVVSESKSVLPAIGVHMAYNFASLVCSGLPLPAFMMQPGFIIALYVVVLVVLIVLLLLVKGWPAPEHPQLIEEEPIENV